MIADHESKQRFDTISDMAAEIADLQKKLADMTAERNEQRTRAVKAQSQVRMLEAQLTNPKKEVFTLSLTITRPEDRVKADNDLAKKLNEGWERFDSAFVANPGEPTLHLITLIRVAPIPAEPDQPAATVVVASEANAATKPTPAATPDPAPEPNPDSLPVTRKTVTTTAIMSIDETPTPITATALDAPLSDRQTARRDEIKAVAQAAYNEALERNPLPVHRSLPSVKSVQEHVSP